MLSKIIYYYKRGAPISFLGKKERLKNTLEGKKEKKIMRVPIGFELVAARESYPLGYRRQSARYMNILAIYSNPNKKANRKQTTRFPIQYTNALS